MKQLLCNDSTGHIKNTTTNKCAKPRGRNTCVLRFTRRRLLCAGAQVLLLSAHSEGVRHRRRMGEGLEERQEAILVLS